MNTTSVLHSEKIPCTQIRGGIHGRFLPGPPPASHPPVINNIHQLCLNMKDHLSFYQIVSGGDLMGSDDDCKFEFISKFEIYAEITSINRYLAITPSKFDSIILGIDNCKIAIVNYDEQFDEMKTICLYAIDPFHTGGKIFSEAEMQIYGDRVNGNIIYVYDDNKISILTKRKSGVEYENEFYYNTVDGDKIFAPSIYINFFEKKFVYKITKLCFYKSYEEDLKYDDNKMDIDESNIENEILTFYILYQDSCLSSNDNDTNQSPLVYTQTKLSVAFVEISLSQKDIIKFDILWSDIDENTFDFLVLPTESEAVNLVLFSPYMIQISYPNEKKSQLILLNRIYESSVLSRNYNLAIFTIDTNYITTNIDLRGGTQLILSQSDFIQTTSNGEMFLFSLAQGHMYSLAKLNGDTLGAPLNTLLMPYPGFFFASSIFSSAFLLKYTTANAYIIKDTINNLSPIVNFHLLNDNKNMKIVFTSNFGSNSTINYVYDKIVYYEIQKTLVTSVNSASGGFSFIKSISFDNDIYSKFLVCKTKNGNSVIFENNGKGFDDVTDKIAYDKEDNLISCSVVKIENLETMSFVAFITSHLIYLFNPLMILIHTIKAKDIFGNEEETIGKCKFGYNSMILTNNNNDKIFILSFHSKSMDTQGFYIEKKINQSIVFRVKDISNIIDISTILKFAINSTLFSNFYSLLIVYRITQSIDVYDVNSLMMIQGNKMASLCHNDIISELPMIISNGNQYYSHFDTDLTTLSTLKEEIANPSTRETPEAMFFDVLHNKTLFCILFKNGTIVIYQMYMPSPYNISFKKIFIEYIQEINYKEFFMMESANIFIKFKNIFGYPGLLINISGNQKFIFEINGAIATIPLNNSPNKHTFAAFTEFSNEEIEHGFLVYEGEKLKHCSIPKNYMLHSSGILYRSNKLNRFPVTLNYIPVYNIPMYYCYILIEKELKPYSAHGAKKFFYYMTLRTEGPTVYDEVAFGENETIVESRIVELPSVSAMTKKYLAIGVNVIDTDKGENSPMRARLQLYEIENGKFKRIYSGDLFKGTISMIHSIDKTLLIGEGSRIFLYQYVPATNEMKKISVIENKNLVTCSKIHSKHLITGDVIESASWMVFTSKAAGATPIIDVLGKDTSAYHSTAIDFWIDQDNSGCILCDDNSNGHVFLIVKEERSAMQLVEVCDFHLGKVINEIRWWLYGGKNNNNVCYYGSDDGSVGYLIPIKNDVFEKLYLLSEFLFNHLPFRAGCNAKGFFNAKNFPYKKEKGRFVDMRLLKTFLKMPLTMQESIAKKIIMGKDQLIKQINDLIV